MDLVDIVNNLINNEKPEFDGKPLFVYEVKVLDNLEHMSAYKNTQLSFPISNEKLLYHGAPLENIESIILDNFNITEALKGMGGHIGQGIYFSDMAEQSIYYCLKNEYTGDETDFIILVCKVELGRCCNRIRSDFDTNCAKFDNYDSHSTPYHQGNKFGHEYCVFDSNQILPVCRLHLKLSGT